MREYEIEEKKKGQIKSGCIEPFDVKPRRRRTPDAQLSPSLFTSLAPRIQRASMATYSSLSAQDRLPLLPTRRLRFDFLTRRCDESRLLHTASVRER